MTSGLASKTCMPAHGAISAVYRPCASIGAIVSMPLALPTAWSSSPCPGDMWTTPVPSSVDT